jgi:hypothetical protein
MHGENEIEVFTTLEQGPRGIQGEQGIQGLQGIPGDNNWKKLINKPTTFPSSAHNHLADFGKYAVYSDGVHRQNITCGTFYEPNVEYGSFYYQYEVKPLGTNGYAHSESAGGGHHILAGFNDAGADGIQSITGNTFNQDTATSFSTRAGIGIRQNCWGTLAISGDCITGFITVIVDGVPAVKISGWSGVRRRNDAYDCMRFLLGSDHQTLKCVIGSVIGFDGLAGVAGILPYDNPHNFAIKPPTARDYIGLTSFQGPTAKPSFLMNFRDLSLNDISAGFGGTVHNGKFTETASNGSVIGISFAENFIQDVSKYPVFVVDPFEYSNLCPAPKTPIVGARIYDSHGRPNVLKAKSQTLNTGVTEVGGLTYNQALNSYGIQEGMVYPTGTSPGPRTVLDSQYNSDIRIMKDVVISSGLDENYTIIFGYTDTSNFNFIVHDPYGSTYMYCVVGGVWTGSQTFNFVPGAWKDFRAVVSGSNVNCYLGNTDLGSRPIAANVTALEKGYQLSSPLCRVREFAVL